MFPFLKTCDRLKRSKSNCKRLTWLKYSCILASLASNSPFTWPTTNLESENISTAFPPIFCTMTIPCSKASYSASFFVAENPSLRCHAPNPIPGFVTMIGMLISSLNLILIRTNLTFSKFFQNASLFLFILVSLLLDIIFHLIVRASTPYSKYNIIHQSLISYFYIIHLLILSGTQLSFDPRIHNNYNAKCQNASLGSIHIKLKPALSKLD